MNRFAPLSEDTLSEQHPISVCLQRTNAPHGHTGIAYIGADGLRKFLHLGFHHDLRDDDLVPHAHRIYAQSGLDDISAQIFCGIVRNIPEFAPKIKYGVNWLGARGSFDVTGKYTPPNDSDGLTCATFVSEIFEGAGFHVVDETTWPANSAGNAEWREEVVQALLDNVEDTPARTAHVEHVRMRDPVVRLFPAQIAGGVASDLDDWALNHDHAVNLAREVIAAFAPL